MKLYIFWTVPLSIIRSLFTVHSAMVDSFRAGPARKLSQTCMAYCKTYTITECTVNGLLMMDRGTVRNM